MNQSRLRNIALLTLLLGLTGAGHLCAQDLYVSDATSSVYKVTTNGASTLFATGFLQPYGLAFDTVGNLYVANNTGNSISMVTTNGVVSTFASGLSFPAGLVFDTVGNLYVANNGGNSISMVTTNGVVSTFVSSGLNGPNGLAFDTSGNLYVANSDGNTISKVTTNGVVSTYASTALYRPGGIAIDTNGILYAANVFSNSLSKVPTNGGSATPWTTTGIAMALPYGLTFDTTGNLYVACYGSDQILKIGTNGAATSYAANVTGGNGPVFLAFAPSAAPTPTVSDLYVGSNSTVAPTNFTSGTNSFGNTFIGYSATASNNTLTIGNTNTLLTNSADLYAGKEGASNSMVISNGGKVVNSTGYVGYGGGASKNLVTVTGTTSLWSNSSDLYVGYYGSSNSLQVTAGGSVVGSNGYIGFDSASSNNSVVIAGASTLTLTGKLYVGQYGSSNSLVVSNQGSALVGDDLLIGLDASASNNSVHVSDVGSSVTVTNGKSLNVGWTGSSNSLVISNGASVNATTLSVGVSSNALSNRVEVGGGSGTSTLNVTGDLNVGFSGSRNRFTITTNGTVSVVSTKIGGDTNANGNIVELAGGSLANSGDLRVGYYGSSNILSITAGTVSVGTNGTATDVGLYASSANNSVSVSGSNSLLQVGSSSRFALGCQGSGNYMTVSNGGHVTVTNSDAILGFDSGSSNNSLTITGAGSSFSNSLSKTFYVGRLGSSNSLSVLGGGTLVTGALRLGASNSSSNNLVLVSGPGSLWTNSGKAYIGRDGSSNSLLISDGGSVLVGSNLYVGYGTNSSNNSILVTGTGSSLSAGAVVVGLQGISNTLTVANGGSISTPNLLIGATNSASGTVNVGTYGGSDTAGTLGASTITFGSGTGTLNFNQSDTVTVTSPIVTLAGGTSSLNQLGSGTTILSGNAQIEYLSVVGGQVRVNGSITNSGIVVFSSNSAASLVISNGHAVSPFGGLNLLASLSNAPGASVLVSGSNAVWDCSYGGSLTLGYGLSVFTSGGGNNLTISNGGKVVAGGVGVGVDSTSFSNAVVVSGPGSSLDAGMSLTIGAGSDWNTLTISNGGLVSDFNGMIASAVNDTNNSVLVTAGGTWSNSGSLTVGETGRGNSLVISNGGTVYNSDGTIGDQSTASNNKVVVTGNSHWSNGGDLYLGNDGSSNSLVISGGGTVTVSGDGGGGNTAPYGMALGMNSGSSNNSLTVEGSNSVLSVSNDLWVGYSGSSNNLTITNGGVVSVAENSSLSAYGMVLGGAISSSNNSVLVHGASSLDDGGDLFVGLSGSFNNLTISGGGTVTASLSAGNNVGTAIGFNSSSSNNRVLVNGSNSTWINSGNLYVGYNGVGNSLMVSSNGTVTAANITIGYAVGAENNSVTLNQGVLNSSGNLYVGNAGSGNSLIVSNGTVSVTTDAYVGPNGSGGLVMVSGGSSTLTVGGIFDIGEYGHGNGLVISNGGTVSIISGSSVGTYSYGNWVRVTGAKSLMTNAGVLNIGYGGDYNLLTVDSNATVVSSYLTIGATNGSGYGSGYGNAVTVSNSGTIAVIHDVNVGGYGSSNSLTISDRGTVLGSNGYIGYAANSSNNSVVVTGSNSIWTNSGTLYVGYSGSGNLTINGGKVFDTIGAIAWTNGSSGSVTVSSNGTWNNSSDLYIGTLGNGGLTIDGGKVSNTNGYVGWNIGAAGSVTVINNGTWSNDGVFLGFNGNGTLTVANGGIVEALGSIIIATNGNGTLNIGSYGGSDSGGTITAPMITFGSGSGTINFNQKDTFRLTSSIVGTGSLNQLGTGTTILSGNTSAFTGVATVYRGALSLPVGLTVSSLIWDSAATIALPGSGSANYLTVTGPVTLTGSGTNTFDLSGLTLGSIPTELFAFGSNTLTTNQFSITGVSDYLLSVSNNALWVAVNGLIANPTNTIITNTATYPTVTFETNGILTITPSADLTITSPVDVTNNGVVVLNGILNTPGLNVAAGGSISGTGTLNANLTNSGVVAPGNGPGTLTVNGNFVQASGGTLLVQVGNGLNSLLTVNGTATLGGALVISSYGGHRFQYGEKITFLSASEIKGSFSSVEVPTGFRGRVKVFGDPQLEVIMAPASYTQMARNRNQSTVATALNSFIPATTGDRLVVSTSLDILNAAEYNQAFNAIMPTFYQQIATIAFNQANALNMELNQRLWGVRLAEGGGFSMSGLADNYAMIQEGQGDGDGKDTKNPAKDILRPGLDNHWGMFVDGNGIFAQANSANMLPGYNSESGGVTAGLTYKWNEHFASGIYTGYQGTYTKSGANGSGLGTGSSLVDNAVRFGVFGTYGQKDGKGFYANALAGGAYHNDQATRIIQYSGMNRTANSSPGAGELDTMLAAGYDLQKGKFTYGPTASLQYTYLGVNGVNETGAQSLNFNSGGWNSSSMLSSVGAHAAYNWQAGKNIVVVPQISLNWQHEFMQNPYAINGNLGGASPTFSNWSATPIRDFLYTGVGFTVEFGKRWNTSFFYNASAGNANLTSQNIFWSAGVKF